MRRMRELKFEPPDIARLVRCSAAGEWMAWEHPADQHARLTLTGIPEFKRAASLLAVRASGESWCVRWRYVSCLAKGPFRQECS